MYVYIYIYIFNKAAMYMIKFVPLIRQDNNNNKNMIQFYSVLVYLSAESTARWPVTETAQHTNTNNKG
jgi:hypothetical protein